MRPVRCVSASRSSITCPSLCLMVQAVPWVTPRRRPSSMLEDPLLRLGHVVEGAEPGAQRHLGGGEDGAGGQRGLASAGTALEQLARPDRAMASLAADRALEALGPAPAEQRLAAGLLGAVLLLELGFAEPLLELH